MNLKLLAKNTHTNDVELLIMVNENVRDRKLVRQSDIVIILILITVAFILFFSFYESDGDSVLAEISIDGKTVMTVNLKKSEEKILGIEDNPNVHFEIKNHQIRFIDVNCPDKICESVGFIGRAKESAICMPNKVSLRIVSNENDIDAVT